MSATFEVHDGCTTLISDEAFALYYAEAAAKAQSAKRNEITCAVLAAAVTFFAIVELIKQAGGLQ